MKKLLPLVILISMGVTQIYAQTNLCNFRFVLWDDSGIGWFPNSGIEITVDGVDYGFVNLSWGTPSSEEIVPLPSGKVQLFWTGGLPASYHFEVYNSLDELIYTGPDFLYGGLFYTYQNECIECLPLIEFEGVYIVEEHIVNLSWEVLESDDLIGFDIYRNDSLIHQLPSTTVFYSDNTTELEEGDYKYCVIPVYPMECDLDEKCFETYISNVGVINYRDNIIVYPNPANNVVNIIGADISNVKVFNNIGQLLLFQHNKNDINVSELQNGIYLLSVEVSAGNTIQKKIIINH